MVGCIDETFIFHVIFSIFVTVTSSHEISGCYGDTVTISCGSDEKINILGDFYGLSPQGSDRKVCAYSENDICVVPSHSHTSVAKQVCNGRTNCIFTISERHTCINGNKETTYQQIKYECIPESKIKSMCSDQTWTTPSGFLTSANYPIFYPPRASCTCTLTTQDDSFILLKTAEFRLKNSSPCRDFLLVEPESNPEETLCGSVHRIFEARAFTLHFRTQLTSFKGFLLSYEATSSVTVACYQGENKSPTPTSPPTKGKSSVPHIHDHHGPKPKEHPTASNTDHNNQQQSKDAGTEETFSEFESGRSDDEDSSILNDSTDSKSSESHSGGTFSDVVPTERPAVTPPLHMVSGCFGDIVHFQCKDGELIRIVEDLYGSAPSGRCSYEENDCVVEAVGQKSIVSQICSSKTRCMNFIVTRMFCGDRVTSYQQITYECVPATAMLNICSQTVMKTSEGYLSSPNFPGMYPRNQSCSCTLRAEGGDVQLSMAHFALHDLKSCEDWLEIDLGDGESAHKLCGSQHGDFRARSVMLTFMSDAKYSHSGFWLYFHGEKGGPVTMACNVPPETVWPTTSAIVSLTPTTTTTKTTQSPPTPTSATQEEEAQPIAKSDSRRILAEGMLNSDAFPHTMAPPSMSNSNQASDLDGNLQEDSYGDKKISSSEQSDGNPPVHEERENRNLLMSNGGDAHITLRDRGYENKGNILLSDEAYQTPTTTTQKQLTNNRKSIATSGSTPQNRWAFRQAQIAVILLLLTSVYIM